MQIGKRSDARWGGEEFIILVPVWTVKWHVRRAEKLAATSGGRVRIGRNDHLQLRHRSNAAGDSAATLIARADKRFNGQK